MKEIFEQYGSVIITVGAILLLIVIIAFLLTTDGVVATAFQDLLKYFFNSATGKIGVTP